MKAFHWNFQFERQLKNLLRKVWELDAKFKLKQKLLIGFHFETWSVYSTVWALTNWSQKERTSFNWTGSKRVNQFGIVHSILHFQPILRTTRLVGSPKWRLIMPSDHRVYSNNRRPQLNFSGDLNRIRGTPFYPNDFINRKSWPKIRPV